MNNKQISQNSPQTKNIDKILKKTNNLVTNVNESNLILFMDSFSFCCLQIVINNNPINKIIVKKRGLKFSPFATPSTTGKLDGNRGYIFTPFKNGISIG